MPVQTANAGENHCQRQSLATAETTTPDCSVHDPVEKRYWNMEHFLRLAEQGRSNPGCSTYERRAWELAKWLSEKMAGFDGRAIEGAIEFLQMSARMPDTAQALLLPRKQSVKRVRR
jgi:hypothetical protein